MLKPTVGMVLQSEVSRGAPQMKEGDGMWDHVDPTAKGRLVVVPVAYSISNSAPYRTTRQHSTMRLASPSWADSTYR